MTSKPNVIVVQKTTGKGATIQGLPGKNVVTTLLNAGVSLTPSTASIQVSLALGTRGQLARLCWKHFIRRFVFVALELEA